MTEKQRPKISVCLATYNGAKFITEQMQSIVPQLQNDDEIIVVDDASSDDTVSTLTTLVGESRVLICRNSRNEGVVTAFEKALQAATGEIIFLSDQDDRWCDNKVSRVLDEFNDPSVTLVITNAKVIDANGRPSDPLPSCLLKRPPTLAFTLLKNQFQGSLMAFRRDILSACLPIPKGTAMHDWWIGAVNAVIGKAVVVREPLMYYRRHSGNVTSGRQNIATILRQRFNLSLNLIRRMLKLRKSRSHGPVLGL